MRGDAQGSFHKQGRIRGDGTAIMKWILSLQMTEKASPLKLKAAEGEPTDCHVTYNIEKESRLPLAVVRKGQAE